MVAETTENDVKLFKELQELVALELKDILATAAGEGFSARDVISALELALQAELQALATSEGPPEPPAPT